MEESLHKPDEEDSRFDEFLQDGCLSLSDQKLSKNRHEIMDWVQRHEDSVETISLDFSGCSMFLEGLVYFFNHALEKLKNLVQLRLHFRDYEIPVNRMTAILESLRNNKPRQFQIIQFRQCNVGEESKNQFVDLLVRYLSEMGDWGIIWNQLRVALSPFLLMSSIKTLSLDVSRDGCTEDGFDTPYGGCVVRLNPLMNSLGFSGCDLEAEGCRTLAGCLEEMPTSLTHLVLDHNFIQNEGVEALASVLAKKHKSLESLDLRSNEIEAEGMVALTNTLAQNQASLKVLRLSSNKIEDGGVMALADGLVGNHASCLEILDLCGNSVGDKGLVALGYALGRNQRPSLKSLDLGFNEFGDEGVMALADGLAENQCVLEFLNLETNRGIGDDGVVALANALHRNQSLIDLDLNDTSTGDRGAIGLSKMLRHNSVLKRLDLDFNRKMTKKSYEALGRAMQHNRVVLALDLPYYTIRDCRWSDCVEFFTGCNSIGFWNILQDENALIPWHKAFRALLKGPMNRNRRGERMAEICNLSMVFVLLQNRPDILKGTVMSHCDTNHQSNHVASSSSENIRKRRRTK